MNAVYAWMCVGLATTAVVAWWVSTQPQLMRSIFKGPTFIVLIVAELALVWVIASAVSRLSTGAATGLFILYSALNGLTLSVIFIVYQLNAIAATFVVTAGMFGAMSLVGYFTKRDLTQLGSFLFMALIGLILASIVNIFFANSTLYWVVTYGGVIIFLGLTAYDTQKMKEIAQGAESQGVDASRLAIVGSLTLYLDFINLFLFLLRILGSRRD
ncbi:MAG: Bax inhibitor-1/YccA family protein [Planctomycetota bacterium]|nr:Bax inhibitor-1/YccA family protein [Planctomycetota bacterium]